MPEQLQTHADDRIEVEAYDGQIRLSVTDANGDEAVAILSPLEAFTVAAALTQEVATFVNPVEVMP